MIMRYTLFIILFTSVFTYGQTCNEITISGKVVDTVESRNFYNLMIINKTSGKGFFGRPDGSFTISAQQGDSIVLSITGYSNVGFIVKGNEYCTQRISKPIRALSYQSSDVVVRPIKTLDQLKEERERLAFNETRTVSGIYVIQSPITALYERFSKRERTKRYVAEMEYKDNMNMVVQELLRNYVSYDIVDLSEEEFIDFVEFLNISDEFLRTASDYDLILFIKDKFEHYRMLNAPGEKFIYKED